MTRRPNAGIPRLQELEFLETAACGVGRGETFEELRLRLISYMEGARQDHEGPGNVATFRLAQANPARYLSNATEALKELMRLGMVERAPLPSTGAAARQYRNTTFALTQAGRRWVSLIERDPRAAYDDLFAMLWDTHAQLEGYLRAIEPSGLVIPSVAWLDLPREHRESDEARDRYRELLTVRVAEQAAVENLGWTAEAREVLGFVTEYLDARYAWARQRSRPDPYPRSRDYIGACEEALVKLAFTKAGCSIDYISVEILRRWTRVLGVAGFSYHVPGPSALRLWPTATISVDAAGRPEATRRSGSIYRDAILADLPQAYEAARASEGSAYLYVPIHRVRAYLCWQHKLPDVAFDRIVQAFVEDPELQRAVGFKLHLEPVMFGSVPPTERPLLLPTRTGATRRFFSMSLVPERIA